MSGKLLVSKLIGTRVFRMKEVSRGTFRPKEIGRIHQVVASEDASRLVGFLVKQKDALGMFKRPDMFVAFDACHSQNGEIRVKDSRENFDVPARTRLGLNWDTCMLPYGMDVKDTHARELGHISDMEVSSKDGTILAYHIDDGKIASHMVGHLSIPRACYQGYQDGFVIVDIDGVPTTLSGGLAEQAGTGYAKAKLEGKKLAKKIGHAVDKSIPEEVREDTARAVGKQLSKSKSMFSDFMSEYKKASK